MLLSMTGFGRAFGTFQEKKISVELKSVNSKGLDVNAKIHQYYRELELRARTFIVQQLERGKVDLQINVENVGTTKPALFNTDLLMAYANDLRTLNAQLGHTNTDYDYLPLLLRIPDIYINRQEQLSEEESEFVLNLVREACEQLTAFRQQEGHAIEKDVHKQIQKIYSLLEDIAPYEQLRVDTIKERILLKLSDLNTIKYDENRLEQELIYYIERLDISEEKARLINHLNYFTETLQSKNSGKKLGFILQEIGREINTLGSKSNQSEMQKLVVEMKDNLEKIKEQILNVL